MKLISNLFSFLYFIILELNKTISLPIPSTYTNTKLQQIIDEQRSEPIVWLNDKNLIDADMVIVVYYLLRNNTVMNILFIFISDEIHLELRVRIKIEN